MRFGITDLYDYVIKDTGHDEQVVKDVVRSSFRGIEHLITRGSVTIRGFGTYGTREWGGWRMKKISNIAEDVFIKKRLIPQFSYSKKIRKKISSIKI